MKNEIQEAIHKEHMCELKKYTVGELIEAIDTQHSFSIRIVGRHDLVSVSSGVKKLCDNAEGGPGIVFRYFKRNLSKDDEKSIYQYYKE